MRLLGGIVLPGEPPLVSAHPFDRDRLNKLLSAIFADDLHAERVASCSSAGVNVLAGATGLNSRRAVRQADQLLSNSGVDPWRLLAS
jgi:hypothetical protein